MTLSFPGYFMLSTDGFTLTMAARTKLFGYTTPNSVGCIRSPTPIRGCIAFHADLGSSISEAPTHGGSLTSQGIRYSSWNDGCCPDPTSVHFVKCARRQERGPSQTETRSVLGQEDRAGARWLVIADFRTEGSRYSCSLLSVSLLDPRKIDSGLQSQAGPAY